MDIGEILSHADGLFRQNRAEKAGNYLKEMSVCALEQEEHGAALSILNELTGYYRNTDQIEAAWDCAEKILTLLELMELWDTVPAATALLNIATVYKAAGQQEKALILYLQCEGIFHREGIEDARLVGLYNNICVASMELKRFEDARIYGEKAAVLAERTAMLPGKKEIVLENFRSAQRAAEGR